MKKPHEIPSSKEIILVSGCLTGDNCFYNGKRKVSGSVKKLAQGKKVIAVCPELLGGLPAPRKRSEIKGGTGRDVLKGECMVVSESGADLTANFVDGAKKALSLARKYNIKKAILKSHSPACGCGEIYDGSFSKKLKKGDGVTCALLKANGIEVIKAD